MAKTQVTDVVVEGSHATCNRCPWMEVDTPKAKQQARKHALATGHTVSVRQTTDFTVKPKPTARATDECFACGGGTIADAVLGDKLCPICAQVVYLDEPKVNEA